MTTTRTAAGTPATRIVRRKGVQAGQPCFAGSRWPTNTVLGYPDDWTDAMIAGQYTRTAGITPEHVRIARRYERRWHRRLGRLAWQARLQVAAWMLGVSRQTLGEMV